MARYDILVVGGGINGSGIARDAAGRGYSVLLAEKSDLGGATSSASTKLIHGGLRYLEYYEFRLVREALIEREILLAAAPHIIRPLRFVLPHHAGLRPRWMLRAGLFLYDHMGGRKLLPATRSVDLYKDETGKPLQTEYRRAFEYSDCWVEDSRLVVLNAMDAAERGAEIRVGTRVVSARRDNSIWVVELEDVSTGARRSAEAAVIVNAAGPWAGELQTKLTGSNGASRVRLVKGSHIVVRRLFDHDKAYIFQNSDGRIVFAIPYEHDFTLIGTTDQDYTGDPGAAHIEAEETEYLCRAVSEYLRQPVRPEDVVWSFSGVRPLYDDGASAAQAATRDYVFDLDTAGGAPLLNIFGGKITTYRRLAEAALSRLTSHLPGRGSAWTADAPLPGGDFAVDGLASLVEGLRLNWPFLAADQARRLARAYGTRAKIVLGSARSADDLGRRFGSDLTEAEVAYLMAHEWARGADDVLWRRSKLGLHLSEAERAGLDAWMQARSGRTASRAAE